MKKTMYVDSILVKGEWKTKQVMTIESGSILDIVDSSDEESKKLESKDLILY